MNDTDLLGELLVEEEKEKGEEALTQRDEKVDDPRKESSVGWMGGVGTGVGAGALMVLLILATSRSSLVGGEDGFRSSLPLRGLSKGG